MDIASSTSNPEENLTLALISCSNVAKSFGCIQYTHADHLDPRPTFAFVRSCFCFSEQLLLQEIGGDMMCSSLSLQYCSRRAYQREARTRLALCWAQKCSGKALIVRMYSL